MPSLSQLCTDSYRMTALENVNSTVVTETHGHLCIINFLTY